MQISATDAPAVPTVQSQRLLVSVVWIAVALVAGAMIATTLAHNTYNYPHAWVSAHFATIGRSFAEQGFAALGFVPVQNNAPLTASPDVYLNWPPLYGMLVGAAFRIFGASETTQHLLALALNFASAGIVYAIVRRRGSDLAGALACLAVLTTPALMRYGQMGSQLHLAIFFTLASLYAYLEATDGKAARIRWACLGAVFFALAILSSWEPILAAPALVLFGLVGRDRWAAALGIAFGLAGTATIIGIFVLYGLQVPYFGDAILERVLLRSGLSSGYDSEAAQALASPHFLQEKAERTDVLGWAYFPKILLRLTLLGPLGLLALACVLLQARRIIKGPARTTLVPIAAFVSIYALWAIAMPNHMSIHDYQILLLVPAAGLAVGLLADELPRLSQRVREEFEAPDRLRVMILLVVFVAVVAGGFDRLKWVRADRGVDDRSIAFARSIGNTVPECSIVTIPDRSMVPVYYADRHLIRAVKDGQTLAANRSAVEALCTECGIYAAIPDKARDSFAHVLGTSSSVMPLDNGALVILREPRATQFCRHQLVLRGQL